MTQLNQQNNPLFTSNIHYSKTFEGYCESDIVYGPDLLMVMDLYYPKTTAKVTAKKMPVVIFVTGYSDSGFEKMTGMKLKDVKQYKSWAQAVAASGIIGITYSNIDPEKDIFTLL